MQVHGRIPASRYCQYLAWQRALVRQYVVCGGVQPGEINPPQSVVATVGTGNGMPGINCDTQPTYCLNEFTFRLLAQINHPGDLHAGLMHIERRLVS